MILVIGDWCVTGHLVTHQSPITSDEMLEEANRAS
jgi:hypothetical protein